MSESYEEDSDDECIEYSYNPNELDFSEKMDIAEEIVDKLRYYSWSHDLNMLMSDKSAYNLTHLIK